ncbi:MAG: glutathione S-transferase [Rhizobiaceae bacterium]
MATPPILYSFRRCPYAMRARLAVATSGIEVELREILLRDKAPELLEASPKATVPVLVQNDGTVLEESLAIMDWALALADPEGWMKPELGTVAEMRELIERCDVEFKPHLDSYKYASRYDEVDGTKERDLAGSYLWELDKRLEEQAYLFGSRISFADMAIVTFIRQFANVDRAWFDAQEWKNLNRWLVEFLQSERFLSIMGKYKKWEPEDATVLFGS